MSCCLPHSYNCPPAPMMRVTTSWSCHVWMGRYQNLEGARTRGVSGAGEIQGGCARPSSTMEQVAWEKHKGKCVACVANCYELRWEPREYQRLKIQQGLGLSLCASPPDISCPQIRWKPKWGCSKVWTKVWRTINIDFRLENICTWSSECIIIKGKHIRVTSFRHISGLEVQNKNRIKENAMWSETEQSFETWNAEGNRNQGQMSKQIIRMNGMNSRSSQMTQQPCTSWPKLSESSEHDLGCTIWRRLRLSDGCVQRCMDQQA